MQYVKIYVALFLPRCLLFLLNLASRKGSIFSCLLMIVVIFSWLFFSALEYWKLKYCRLASVPTTIKISGWKCFPKEYTGLRSLHDALSDQIQGETTTHEASSVAKCWKECSQKYLLLLPVEPLCCHIQKPHLQDRSSPKIQSLPVNSTASAVNKLWSKPYLETSSISCAWIFSSVKWGWE